ncbi:hypothetical protein Mx4_p75 [Myxococcus phage Mx4]|nr:hypothetical protein Mx4_p75 [Myxococcus phage Mx4]
MPQGRLEGARLGARRAPRGRPFAPSAPAERPCRPAGSPRPRSTSQGPPSSSAAGACRPARTTPPGCPRTRSARPGPRGSRPGRTCPPAPPLGTQTARAAPSTGTAPPQGRARRWQRGPPPAGGRSSWLATLPSARQRALAGKLRRHRAVGIGEDWLRLGGHLEWLRRQYAAKQRQQPHQRSGVALVVGGEDVDETPEELVRAEGQRNQRGRQQRLADCPLRRAPAESGQVEGHAAQAGADEVVRVGHELARGEKATTEGEGQPLQAGGDEGLNHERGLLLRVVPGGARPGGGVEAVQEDFLAPVHSLHGRVDVPEPLLEDAELLLGIRSGAVERPD